MRKAATAPDPAPHPAAPAARAPGKGLRAFPAGFWLINGIELVERSAYYGMLSIFTFHWVTQRGFEPSFIGLILAVLQALLYFVPLVAAALAEKYGYRASLFAAFTAALAGYALIGSTESLRGALGPAALLPGVIALGVGAGAFKPIAAAIVAQTSSPEQRNFAFTIYYAFVNIGGFIGPLLIGLLIPEALYGVVFFGSAIAIALNLVIVAVAYRNVAVPQTGKSVRQALGALAGLRKDPGYVAVLVAFAGFWFMYAQYQFFLQVYAPAYGLIPPWLNVALLATINPATIILAGPIIGKAAERFPSLPLVMIGSGIYILGIVLLGFVPNPLLLIAGLIVLSVGEVMAQPSFLSYTSKIAPKDKLAVYLG
ncbi:MAG TPA: MFS transporter, partial [Candidatus Thermoplasmatota archaeon]|nr:MFS transporter [Candidatus Thermoplasmatota archaeon]